MSAQSNLPTATNLLTMSYCFGGQPFVYIATRQSIHPNDLSVVDSCQPSGYIVCAYLPYSMFLSFG